ncbi:MAG: NAD(P)/FAD-dependent oxidoreductase, partial [Nocardioidaceae bacterium]
PLGLRLPLAPAKGYVIDLETRPGDPTQPVGLKEDMVVVTPYPDRLRLAGTLELVGRDTTIDHLRTGAIRAAADRVLPPLRDRRTLSVWAGLRPCSADGLPMVGASSTMDGLLVATGHGQQGLVLAPGTGRLIADMLAGRTSSATDAVRTALRPDRFRTLSTVAPIKR